MEDTTNRKISSHEQREIEDLVIDLRSTLVAKRLLAVKKLGKLGSILAIDHLVQVLYDRSKEVRCASIEAITLIKPKNLAELLITSASDKSSDVRLRVAHSLGKCKDKSAINTLLTLLKDSNDEVANMAVKSIAKHPSDCLPILIKQFSDKSWIIRSRSAAAVRLIGKSAAPMLKSALDNINPDTRFWTVTCLGGLRDYANIKLLLEKLHDPEISVRIATIKALRETGDPSIAGKLFDALSQPSDQIRDLIYEVLKDFSTHSIPHLIESLSNEYWTARSLAAQSLFDMGSEAVFPLVLSLEEQDKEKKYWAIKILGKMRETSAFPKIKKFLSDENPDIRMVTLDAVANFQDPEVIPQIIEKFLDPVWLVRKHAAKAIAKFGQKAIPHLLKALNSIEEDIRHWSLRAINIIKPPNVHTHLIRLFKDKSWAIRKTTSEVMANCGENALMELTALATNSNDDEVKYWVLRSLGKIRSTVSLPLLYKALDDPSTSIRDAAQKSLSCYGANVFEDLFLLLKNEKRLLLQSICRTFWYMNPAEVVRFLAKKIGKMTDHENYWIRQILIGLKSPPITPIIELLQSNANEVRRNAILCIGKMGTREHSNHILPHLKDEYWDARVASAEALGDLGNPESTLHLCEALEDEDENLALAAVNALIKIADKRAIPSFISTLSRESWSLKYKAIYILGEMRVNRAFLDLLKLLDEDTLDLKAHLIRAISRLSHPKCYNELKLRFDMEKDPALRSAYILGLAEVGNHAIVPQFIRLAQPDNSVEERITALKALAIIKAVKAKSAIIGALKDKNPAISREALSALQKILPPLEFKETEDLLKNAQKKQEKFKLAFNEGMRYMRLGAMNEAEAQLKEAIKHNSKAAYVYSALGNLYYKTGKLTNSTKAYLMATTLNPSDTVLKLNLGMVYYRRKAYHEAEQVFEKVIKLSPSNTQQAAYANKMLNKIKVEQQQNPFK